MPFHPQRYETPNGRHDKKANEKRNKQRFPMQRDLRFKLLERSWSDVTGTGPGGRIGQEDVKAHVKGRMQSGGASGVAYRTPALPDFSKWGPIDAKPMSNIRRKTAEHLSDAWQAPHVTQHDKADVTALEDFRKAYGARV